MHHANEGADYIVKRGGGADIEAREHKGERERTGERENIRERCGLSERRLLCNGAADDCLAHTDPFIRTHRKYTACKCVRLAGMNMLVSACVCQEK